MATTRAHGDWRRYRAGCRCRRCKSAWSDYCKRMTERRTGGELPTSVALSALGRQILAAAQSRTGRSASAVMDQLLRQFGHTITEGD